MAETKAAKAKDTTADVEEVQGLADAEEVQGSKASADFSTPDKPKPREENVSDATTQSYVWLADGSVLRVKNEDIPTGGHQSLGHWQRGDKVFQIVAIYPVEEKGIVDDE